MTGRLEKGGHTGQAHRWVGIRGRPAKAGPAVTRERRKSGSRAAIEVGSSVAYIVGRGRIRG
jgi:hypothetical protein